jgi:hypothetical protein
LKSNPVGRSRTLTEPAAWWHATSKATAVVVVGDDVSLVLDAIIPTQNGIVDAAGDLV